MEIALIGLPQSGKTTLLHALTKGRVEAGSFGAGKQDVQTGTSRMADPRLTTLKGIFTPEKVVPVEIKYFDIPAAPSEVTGESVASLNPAGLTPQGRNLLERADALVHVVRAFQDPSVPHVNMSIDPSRDAANMDMELAYSDLTIIERRLGRIDTDLKGAKGHDKDVVLKEAALLQRLKGGLEKDIPVRDQGLLPDDREVLSNYQFLTAKPLQLLLNLDETQIDKADDLENELSQAYQAPGVKITPVCGKLEKELSELSNEEESEFRESMGLQESGVDQVVRTSYALLGLISFFTCGPKEVKAWTVACGTPAVKAAGKIHSDIERGFIRAEVMAYNDLVECGSEAQTKKRGLLRLQGKTYQVQDGDIINILFNV